jgi:hypothetical protein
MSGTKVGIKKDKKINFFTIKAQKTLLVYPRLRKHFNSEYSGKFKRGIFCLAEGSTSKLRRTGRTDCRNAQDHS